MTPPETLPVPERAFVERTFVPFWAAVGRYHRYTLVGAENIPRSGPALILSTHSAATYDMFLFMARAYETSGRIIRTLGHSLWFRVPVLKDVCPRFGAVVADPVSARCLLERDEVVMVPPGGMWEALRPSRERHQLRWAERRGFARLARETGVPVLLLTCPAADDVSTIYPSAFTDWAYRRFKLPLPLLRGIGPTVIPRPLRLTAYLSAPVPPRTTAERFEGTDDEVFRRTLIEAMEKHLEASIATDDRWGFALNEL